MAEDEDSSSSYHISIPTIPSATGAGITYDTTQHDASTGIPNHSPAENESTTNDTAAAAGTSSTMRY